MRYSIRTQLMKVLLLTLTPTYCVTPEASSSSFQGFIFPLFFVCLLYCNCDFWGREGNNVPWLRTSWELLQQKSSEQPEGLLVKTLLCSGLISILLESSWAFNKLASSRHLQWHQETALKWGISLNEIPCISWWSRTVALEFSGKSTDQECTMIL